jgi:hypothetical protein
MLQGAFILDKEEPFHLFLVQKFSVSDWLGVGRACPAPVVLGERAAH